MRKQQKGFSLIELLIVVAIILIIAAIAIPNLLRSKMAANEASGVGSVRMINNAQVLYSTTYPDTGYSTLASLGGALPCTPAPAGACIIDNTIATGGTKSGYQFKSTGTGGGGGNPNINFTVNGNAVSANTGSRNFFSDQTFVIRYNTDVTTDALATDKPIQ